MRKQKNMPGIGAYMLRFSTELERGGRHGTSHTYAKMRKSIIARLLTLDLEEDGELSLARDLFVLSSG